MNAAVLVYPGSNCDRDVVRAWEAATGGRAEMVWHATWRAGAPGLVVIPGGFTFGDYLRAGALAARSPSLPQLRQHVASGGLVLGICNGFQVLVEGGLLPGAFMQNACGHFLCRQATLLVESDFGPFMQDFTTGERLSLPIAHGHGRYVLDEGEAAALGAAGRVALRYQWAPGEVGNGSTQNIAGVLDETGRVLGLMPHPERASEAILGSEDGARLLRSAARHLSKALA